MSNNRALTRNLFSNHSRVSNHSFCNSQSTRVRPFSVNTIFPIFFCLCFQLRSNQGKSNTLPKSNTEDASTFFVSHLHLLHQQLPMNFLLSHCSMPAFFKRMFMYLFGCAGSQLQNAGSSVFTVACVIFNCGMQSLSCGMWHLIL